MPLSTRLPVVESSTPQLFERLRRPSTTEGRGFLLATLATLYLVALATFALRAPLPGSRDVALTIIFVVDAIGLTVLAVRFAEGRRA